MGAAAGYGTAEMEQDRRSAPLSACNYLAGRPSSADGAGAAITHQRTGKGFGGLAPRPRTPAECGPPGGSKGGRSAPLARAQCSTLRGQST